MLNLPNIAPLDQDLDAEIREKIDAKTKPLGSLGKLEAVARQIALIQNTRSPRASGCELLLFAGDHGIAESGVSAFPAEVTRQMVLNFAGGGAAANVFANQHGIPIKIIDTGVLGDPVEFDQVISRRLGGGTNNFLHDRAMKREVMEDALSNGIALIKEIESAFVAFGEMGIANTSSAAMLVHKLSDYSLSELVGRGTGLDDAGLAQKLTILEKAANRTNRHLSPLDALEQYGGFEIATMCGAMLGAAAEGKTLLVDGYIATSALLTASHIQSNVLDYCVFCHNSAESGHALMLESLNATALVDLNLRLGEGTGALLAWPLIQSACYMINQMASFADAGVSDKT